MLQRMLTNMMQMKRRWLGMWAGVVIWILWMIFGFWAIILLLILGAVGFVIGRVLEENQSWKQVVERLLSERYGD
ncbi:DUF2273 domain-containing protein [Alicyclobacillus sp. SO9]|nr:DUF2273 domain-containing protein [Alicyclobacillus sp. SO9]